MIINQIALTYQLSYFCNYQQVLWSRQMLYFFFFCILNNLYLQTVQGGRIGIN
ncbi:hypothetical protein BD560DRAFT_395446 [Blakeslea trispora]|nr:hypothetical protein BD560DRAFT_395446 [Blakeslea trispora]